MLTLRIVVPGRASEGPHGSGSHATPRAASSLSTGFIVPVSPDFDLLDMLGPLKRVNTNLKSSRAIIQFGKTLSTSTSPYWPTSLRHHHPAFAVELDRLVCVSVCVGGGGGGGCVRGDDHTTTTTMWVWIRVVWEEKDDDEMLSPHVLTAPSSLESISASPESSRNLTSCSACCKLTEPGLDGPRCGAVVTRFGLGKLSGDGKEGVDGSSVMVRPCAHRHRCA